MKWTKRSRIAVAVICVALATAGLVIFSQMDQVVEAAILKPKESAPSPYTFYDDFSGDLSNWTVVSGGWTIENGKLRCVVTDSSDAPHPIYVDNPLENFVYQAKLQKISGHWAGLMFRGSSPPSESGEYYMVLLGDSGAGVDSYLVGKRSAGNWGILKSWSKLTGLDVSVGAAVKVDFNNSMLRVYINGTMIYSGSDDFRSNGVFGCIASGKTANTEWNFDDINVTSSLAPVIPTAYELNIRAGVTKIIITCTWSGSGNITIANLTSPTTTFNETDMELYERTTFSSLQSIAFNLKRAVLTIVKTSSQETWVIDLNLEGVDACQVSAETS